jgi:hypothetical protein
MRKTIIVLVTLLFGGCADQSADLRTQAQQEGAFVRELDDLIGNAGYSERPFGP